MFTNFEKIKSQIPINNAKIATDDITAMVELIRSSLEDHDTFLSSVFTSK